MYDDIIYDLEPKIDNRGVSYKVIDKKPRTNPTAEEYDAILEETLEYFKSIGAVVRSASRSEINLIINNSEKESLSEEAIKSFVKEAMYDYVDFTYTGEFDLPNIKYSYTYNPNEENEAGKENQVGYFASYYNWLVGNSSTTADDLDNNKSAKPSLK